MGHAGLARTGTKSGIPRQGSKCPSHNTRHGTVACTGTNTSPVPCEKNSHNSSTSGVTPRGERSRESSKASAGGVADRTRPRRAMSQRMKRQVAGERTT